MRKKTNKIIIVLISIIILLGITLILLDQKDRLTTVKKNSLEKVELESDQNEVELNYVFDNESIANTSESMRVYKIEEIQALDSDVINMVSQDLGFDTDRIRVIATNHLVSNGDEELIFETNSGLIEYGFYGEALNIRLSERRVEDKADEFLNKIGIINSNLDFEKLNKTYYRELGFNYVETEDENESDFIGIEYGYSIDGYPLLDSQSKGNAIEVLMNWDGSVKRASINYIGSIILSNLGTAKLVKNKEALEAISRGMGIISSISDPSSPYTNLTEESFIENIPELGPTEIGKNVVFNDVEIVYVWDIETKMIQPYYRFRGTLNTAKTKGLMVEMLITALPEKLYKDK